MLFRHSRLGIPHAALERAAVHHNPSCPRSKELAHRGACPQPARLRPINALTNLPTTSPSPGQIGNTHHHPSIWWGRRDAVRMANLVYKNSSSQSDWDPRHPRSTEIVDASCGSFSSWSYELDAARLFLQRRDKHFRLRRLEGSAARQTGSGSVMGGGSVSRRAFATVCLPAYRHLRFSLPVWFFCMPCWCSWRVAGQVGR